MRIVIIWEEDERRLSNITDSIVVVVVVLYSVRVVYWQRSLDV